MQSYNHPRFFKFFLPRLTQATGRSILAAAALSFVSTFPVTGIGQQPAKPTEQATSNDILATAQANANKFAEAFSAGKVDDVVSHFGDGAEFVDEAGTIYQGIDEIKTVFTEFFKNFPNAKLTMEVESVRPIGSKLMVEEGTRLIESKDGTTASLRYISVTSKESGNWKIAMIREFSNDQPSASFDYLAPLSLLEGEWIDENPAGITRVSYKWNEEKTFLLGEYTVQIAGRPAMKSSQRLGWDPIQMKIRSWTFDSDGGFSEGAWTPTENGWLVKSTATLPSGQVGSATLTINLKDEDRISIKSTDRVVGDSIEEPFEITIVRRPPAPAK